VPPQQGSGSVNEALARGLRTRIVKDVAAAEAAMMRLALHTGRDRAHHIVYAACVRARERGTTLQADLEADAAVTTHLSMAGIAAALDPASYLGAAGAMVDRVLGGRG